MDDSLITIILDWDYETFTVLENLDIMIFDDEIKSGYPQQIYIEGWPYPGWSLEKTLANRVDNFTYRLTDRLPFTTSTAISQR